MESFVRELSTNLQEFDDTVRDQQEAIKRSIGVELEDTRLQIDQINLTDLEHKGKFSKAL